MSAVRLRWPNVLREMFIIVTCKTDMDVAGTAVRLGSRTLHWQSERSLAAAATAWPTTTASAERKSRSFTGMEDVQCRDPWPQWWMLAQLSGDADPHSFRKTRLCRPYAFEGSSR
jgi:hypothetical protein